MYAEVGNKACTIFIAYLLLVLRTEASAMLQLIQTQGWLRKENLPQFLQFVDR